MSEQKDFMLDKIKEKIPNTGSISVGITWIDGRCIFKPEAKHAQCWYGVCHFSDMVCSIAPIDYRDATMVKSIDVSPSEMYCEKAFTCLNFDCMSRHPISGAPVKMNKFDKNLYVYEFKDVGFSSLGLRTNFGEETLWFNDRVTIGGKTIHFKTFWGNLIQPYKPQGAVLEYMEYQNSDMRLS